MRSCRSVVAVVICGLALSSCAASTAVATIVADDSRALVSNRGDSGMDAGIVGTVALDDNSCWALQDTNGSLHAIIWPQGTHFLDGKLSTTDGVAVELGDDIQGGGGELDAAELTFDSGQCLTGYTTVILTWTIRDATSSG